jgi:glycosyltransferase involved in cell wall biosynthesis
MAKSVLYNKKNRGFAPTINRGIKHGNCPYVVVLNSDVIVTENWLSKMLVGMEADSRNVIANPVTNNTAMVNVNMYEGRSYLDMSEALDRSPLTKYPETMPTGFCYMFRRSLFTEIGQFDEAYGSYGEESDFWFRALHYVDNLGNLKNYRAVIVDNCYVYHERGTSFSQLGEDAHWDQRLSGSRRFKRLHPGFGEWNKGFNIEDCIGALRTSISPASFKRKYKGNVAWVVKSAGPCGGMYFITDIANKLIEEGFNVKLCVIPDDPSIKNPTMVGNLHCMPIMFTDTEEFVKTFSSRVFGKGTIFTGIAEFSKYVKKISDDNPEIIGYNHVQSWDIALAEDQRRMDLIPEMKEAYSLLPNIVSSGWVAKEVKKVGGDVEKVILPGVDPDLFHNKGHRKNGDERPTIAVMMTKNYTFKGYGRGIAFCQAIELEAKKRGTDVRVLAIGSDSVPECPSVTGVGGLSQSGMANLLSNEVDLFVDPSHIHSYGLPVLEALFCGNKALCWENMGVHEYRKHFTKTWKLKVLKNDIDPRAAANHALDFLGTNITKTQQSALKKVLKMPTLDRHTAISSFIKACFPEADKTKSVRVEIVTPHIRKHGGPTTNISIGSQLQEAGHDVSISMIYQDWNPEVFNSIPYQIRTKWKQQPPNVKVVIINSDNPFAQELMEANPDKKYIMYKLSHNERFKKAETDNLNLPWDHIITSTGWLRDVCITPAKNWTHKAWDPEQVDVVGWYHYGHEIFNCYPQNRIYGDSASGFRVGTLIHAHQLKGTDVAIGALNGLKKKWEGQMHVIGIGETKAKLPHYVQYIQSASRGEMAYIMSQLDVWLGASHTEGLGRMALEAMSAGVPVVTTNTGAEFLKDGENCLLFEPGDSQKAAELIDALVQDHEMTQTLVANGYTTAVNAANPIPFRKRASKIILKVIENG